MSMTRRAWMQRMVALGVGCMVLPTLGCVEEVGEEGLPTYAYDGPLGPESLFEHGVASGDPLVDAVLLWTRVSVEGDEAVDVFLEVASDPRFEQRVAAAWYVVDGTTDHCLTVDATELDAGTTYYYRFSALGRTSPVGRTRTTPREALRVRWGVCSCSNYGHGHFHAYRHMADRADLDAILHLGDYVYEYASAGHGRTYGLFRELDPLNETVSLDDYRRRYALYRRDEHLQELHRQNPFIHVWDDHEFANDPEIGGADNHTADDEGDWSERVEAALQAYAEWMPTRLRERNQIYRAFDFGGLARLVILDRQRRYLWPEEDDEGYLGTAQSAWLQQVIADTTASWLIFGQGTTFGPRDADGVSRSSWDAASRGDVLAAVAEAGLEELVVLTGDIHKFDALDVVADPASYDPETGEGSAAVEFAVGSVSSPGSTSSFESVPQHFWSDGDHRGYCVVDVTPDEVQVDFFGFEDLLKIGPVGPEETHLKSYVVQRGSHHAVEVFAPLASREGPEKAP